MFIVLLGGAWCYDPAMCKTRSRTNYGSSDIKYRAADCSAAKRAVGYLSPEPNYTLSYNYNMAFVNYCDGGSFAGDAEMQFEVTLCTQIHILCKHIPYIHVNICRIQFYISKEL